MCIFPLNWFTQLWHIWAFFIFISSCGGNRWTVCVCVYTLTGSVLYIYTTTHFPVWSFSSSLVMLLFLNWSVQETLEGFVLQFHNRASICYEQSYEVQHNLVIPTRSMLIEHWYNLLPVPQRNTSQDLLLLKSFFFLQPEKCAWISVFVWSISDIQWLPMQMLKMFNLNCWGTPKLPPSPSLTDSN